MQREKVHWVRAASNNKQLPFFQRPSTLINSYRFYYQCIHLKMFPGKESRHQSGWEEEALLELLFRAPNLVTNDDLLNISLSNLAKNVNDELSASFIMKIYCRWLEVHRRSPLQLFKAWPNTIKQWVESLEHRGVDKEIVIAHVVDWKKDSGPSTINGAKGWIEEKHLPSVDEIERVFDEKHSLNKDKPSDKGCFDRGEYRSDRPSSKSDLGGARSEYVPSSYICNRCGKNGMDPFQNTLR